MLIQLLELILRLLIGLIMTWLSLYVYIHKEGVVKFGSFDFLFFFFLFLQLLCHCLYLCYILSCYYFSPLILSGKFVGGFLLINSVFVSNDLLTMLPFYWLCYMISMCQQLF